jgi:16S rRNA (guanine527-N7)-methyltransferase
MNSEIKSPETEPFAHDPQAAVQLAETLKKQAISLSQGKINRLAKYCELLWFWNEKINLTRHTDFEKFVSRDVVDSLALAEFLLTGERILDVGTGGGVPGIILAIVRPDLEVELCDSTGKKAKVASEIVQSLKLNIPVWHSKAEDLFTARKYTTLTVRAVSKMPKLLELFAPHWHSFERILMLKGPNWVAERGESRHYGYMEKLALRVLKSYPLPSNTVNDEVTTESVVLQICQKAKFEKLAEQIQTVIKTKAFLRKKKEEPVIRKRR